MASARPRERARPSPSPVELSVSPSRWKGRNAPCRAAPFSPGPRSVTRSSTRPERASAATETGRPAGEWRRALASRCARMRASCAGSARTAGAAATPRTDTSAPAKRFSTAGSTSLQPVGRGRGRSIPVCNRLMSTKSSTSRPNRASDSSVALRSSSRSSALKSTSRLRSEPTAARAPARGVRRSWLTAASMAARIWSAASGGRFRGGWSWSGRRRGRPCADRTPSAPGAVPGAVPGDAPRVPSGRPAGRPGIRTDPGRRARGAGVRPGRPRSRDRRRSQQSLRTPCVRVQGRSRKPTPVAHRAPLPIGTPVDGPLARIAHTLTPI